MRQAKAIDLFCGAGGATRGLQQAGFHVTGVDLVASPRYVGDAFIQADALTVPLDGYDFIWASPPCQQYTPLRARQGWREYPDLVVATRARLVAAGAPYVIENVPGAPLLHYITLCGTMFGLRTYRHRRFECSWLVMQPEHPRHLIRASTKKRRTDWDAGMFISVTGDVGVYCGREAMGIEWMSGNELSQAIPPAYARFVGEQAMALLARKESAA